MDAQARCVRQDNRRRRREMTGYLVPADMTIPEKYRCICQQAREAGKYLIMVRVDDLELILAEAERLRQEENDDANRD
jgi:hypothetical protein